MATRRVASAVSQHGPVRPGAVRLFPTSLPRGITTLRMMDARWLGLHYMLVEAKGPPLGYDEGKNGTTLRVDGARLRSCTLPNMPPCTCLCPNVEFGGCLCDFLLFSVGTELRTALRAAVLLASSFGGGVGAAPALSGESNADW